MSVLINPYSVAAAGGGGGGGTITFVGSKSFGHQSTSAQSCSLTDLKDESNVNATLLENDLVVVNLIQSYNTARSEAQMLISGFTAAFTPPTYANFAWDCEQLVQYAFMSSSPLSSINIPATDSSDRPVHCVIHAFRGVSLSSPLDVAAQTATGTATSIANAPAITPTTAGAWILACGGHSSTQDCDFTNPTGMSATTNHFKQGRTGSGGSAGRIGAGTALYTTWASGSYDPAAFGLTGTNRTDTDSWSAATLALRPS